MQKELKEKIKKDHKSNLEGKKKKKELEVKETRSKISESLSDDEVIIVEEECECIEILSDNEAREQKKVRSAGEEAKMLSEKEQLDKNNFKDASNSNEAKGGIVCEICCKMYASKRKLKIHVEMVHERKINCYCLHCPRGFYDKAKLRRHLATHIYVNDDTSNSNRPYQCSHEGCEKYFKIKYERHRHMKRVH